MEVRIWGCRGSLPTPGPESVRYGGNTTCLEIRLRDGTVIIIDAGSGIRLLGERIAEAKDQKDICLLLTHGHWDHLHGFPFFRPAYMPGFRIKVIAGATEEVDGLKYLSHQMKPPFFPVRFEDLNADFVFEDWSRGKLKLASAEIIPIPLNHPDGGFGYKLIEDGKSFVFLTDNELFFEHSGGLKRQRYVEWCKGADLLLHDAQYGEKEYESRTRGWGHTTYLQATQLAIDSGVKSFGLFHHDPSRSDDMIDGLVEECSGLIRKSGLAIECFGARDGMKLVV